MRNRDALLLILIAFIWGFNFVVIRWGLNEFPPLLFSALRFSVCALPIAFGVPRPPIRWTNLLLIGLTLGLCVFGLLYLGIYAGMNAGIASAVMQAQVFFTLTISYLLLGERLGRANVFTIILGFSGLAMIFLSDRDHATPAGFAFVLLGALSWGVSNVLIKRLPKVQTLHLMIWISIVPPLPLFILSYLFEPQYTASDLVIQLKWTGVLAVLYTSALSTIFAYGVWGGMLQRYSAAAVSPFALLVPVFGLACAALFLGFRPTASDLIGPALVVIALVVNWRGNRAPAKRPEANDSSALQASARVTRSSIRYHQPR